MASSHQGNKNINQSTCAMSTRAVTYGWVEFFCQKMKDNDILANNGAQRCQTGGSINMPEQIFI